MAVKESEAVAHVLACFYQPEAVRAAIVDEVYDGREGSLSNKLMALGVTSSSFHQMRLRRLGILTVFLERLGLWRVCQGQHIIGYLSRTPIYPPAIWRT